MSGGGEGRGEKASETVFSENGCGGLFPACKRLRSRRKTKFQAAKTMLATVIGKVNPMTAKKSKRLICRKSSSKMRVHLADNGVSTLARKIRLAAADTGRKRSNQRRSTHGTASAC